MLSVEEVCQSLEKKILDKEFKQNIIDKMNSRKLADRLNEDKSISIYLYTIESNIRWEQFLCNSKSKTSTMAQILIVFSS